MLPILENALDVLVALGWQGCQCKDQGAVMNISESEKAWLIPAYPGAIVCGAMNCLVKEAAQLLVRLLFVDLIFPLFTDFYCCGSTFLQATFMTTNNR